MAKKKKAQVTEPTREELSEFAYQPTGAEGLDEGKPFGSQSYKHMKGLLMQRVNPSRYVHSISVAKTARKLARVYGYDGHIARMAGLLHDWDKALLPAQLQQRISDFDLKVSPDVINGMPWVLHGPTAAAVLRRDFPCFGEEVFQAIERHTVGAPDMAPLDMIVFAADKIEPTHDVAEYKRLYKQIGTMSLEELFYAVLKEGMSYLVRAGKPISYDSVTVWNCYNGAKPSRTIKENISGRNIFS